ncbi:hypothetical protein BS47DRAFT_1350799 [Hydnum rufescens UP504]|uniref:Secreted protein n=1 Tax=Hydnum rufescens UP504 TaxID=1448309 RepID=A0A9P6ALM8_9AGAM|nr:hypothetical protein BS47DRAFT_1350799 [Hydnum rufescens UP504]
MAMKIWRMIVCFSFAGLSALRGNWRVKVLSVWSVWSVQNVANVLKIANATFVRATLPSKPQTERGKRLINHMLSQWES